MEAQSSVEGFGLALAKAVDWIRGYNSRVDATRLSQYLKTIQEIVAAPDLKARFDDPTFQRALEALLAGGELHFIHRYLAASQDADLQQKIRDFAKGPYFQQDEDAANSSNLARNTGFELYFAAQLMRAGFAVTVGRGTDVQVDAPLVHFECKRPQSIGKIETNLRKARNQLHNRHRGGNAPTVIALSVGKVLEGPRDLIYPGTAAELDDAIDADLRRFKERFERIWRESSFGGISAIWLHYARIVVLTNPTTFARRAYDRIIVLGAGGANHAHKATLEAVAAAVVRSDQIEEF